MTIPVFDLTRQYALIRDDIRTAIDRVLDSGKYVLGSEGIAFEQSFAAYIGTAHGIGVNSGTDALKIALKALNVGAGDEVITVANTAVPTVSAIRETGAMPVFADSDEYFTIDVNQIEKNITQKTKAIVVVHLYGQPADMDAIMAIAKAHKLFVVEDCAQAVGADIGDRKVGTFGDISCFSFYPTKNLGAYGDGGMILTNDGSLADRCRKLRFYGMGTAYHADEEGFNSRLDEIQAAVLHAKLPHLEVWNERRRTIANFYTSHITNTLIELPKERPGTRHVFHLFVIKSAQREVLKKFLTGKGISFGIHYEFPIHLQKAYAFLDIPKGSLPNTEANAKKILSLPLFPELIDEELDYITTTLNDFS